MLNQLETLDIIRHERPKRVETENGRVYVTPAGNFYPSVTRIIAETETEDKKRWLQKWRDGVGHQTAKLISQRAAKRGTVLHGLVEEKLTGIRNDKISDAARLLYRDHWRRLEPVLSLIDEIYFCEFLSWSDSFKVGGTIDMVGVWKGKLSILDLKTSTKAKTNKKMPDYWIQLSAYTKMMEEDTGKEFNNLVIIQLPEEGNPLVQEEHKDKWIGSFIDRREKWERIHSED